MADLRTAVVPNPDRVKYSGGFAAVTVPGSQQASQALASMDEILSRRFGNRGPISERAVSWNDLVNAGLVELNYGGRRYVRGPGTVGEPPFAEPVPSPSRPERPSLPTGLIGYGAETTIILTWDRPTYSGHAFTEIYKSASSALNTAVLAGRTGSRAYADRVGAAASFYYWIRFVNELGEVGPFTQVGLQVTSGTANPGDTQIAYDLLVIDRGIIVEALIGDAEIGGAKIKNATIDTAKIISLAANKITAGALQVGSYITSSNFATGVAGFRINADGTAEFNQVTVVGTIEAGSTITAPDIIGGTIDAADITAGTIDGTAITGGTIYGTTISAGELIATILRNTAATQYIRFDGAGTYILKTPNANILTTGETEFNNALFSGTWNLGTSASTLMWEQTDPGPGNVFQGA